MALEYLCQLVSVYNPERTLPSQKNYIFIRKKAFSWATPEVCNRQKKTLIQLKTYIVNTWPHMAIHGDTWKYMAMNGYTIPANFF